MQPRKRDRTAATSTERNSLRRANSSSVGNGSGETIFPSVELRGQDVSADLATIDHSHRGVESTIWLLSRGAAGPPARTAQASPFGSRGRAQPCSAGPRMGHSAAVDVAACARRHVAACARRRCEWQATYGQTFSGGRREPEMPRGQANLKRARQSTRREPYHRAAPIKPALRRRSAHHCGWHLPSGHIEKSPPSFPRGRLQIDAAGSISRRSSGSRPNSYRYGLGRARTARAGPRSGCRSRPAQRQRCVRTRRHRHHPAE
jgi:hypothetical protein